MEMRRFGNTDLHVSVLGFGCGAVGGLMVRGAETDQERAVARALEAGVNYFDTAVQYRRRRVRKESRARASQAKAGEHHHRNKGAAAAV